MSLKADLQRHIASGKRFLVVGLGKTGVEAARFLHRLGAPVTVIENKSEDEFLNREEQRNVYAELCRYGVSISFGGIVPELYDVALAIMSPGVPLGSQVPKILRENGIPLISELELGIELAESPSLIVTGTNGKSTTVSLLHRMVDQESAPALLCGNIGTPVLSVLALAGFFDGQREGSATLVVEASSYQLEACALVKPKIGVLMNLSENHLERHGSMEQYLAAKARLFRNQDAGDFAILNRDCQWSWSLRDKVRATVVPVGTSVALADSLHGARIEYVPSQKLDRVLVKIHGVEEIYETSTSQLIGAHNRFNIAVALVAARLHGVSPDHLRRTIETFSPLDHRLERVSAGPARFIINDSKATTVAASVVALRAVREAFPDRAVKLLIGGLAKTGSWEPLVKAVRQEGDLVRLSCFGRDGKMLHGVFREAGIPSMEFSTLKSAALYCFEALKSDEIMLLSPGCASFDEFSDFEDRGRAFKSIIKERVRQG